MVMTVEQASKELAELELKLQELLSLQQRRELLRQFVTLGEQLSSPASGSAPVPSAAGAGVKETAEKGQTTQMVYRILREHGKLQMGELLKKAREAGWPCSGDDITDKSRIYAAMHRQPKRFKSHGAGQWSAKEEAG